MKSVLTMITVMILATSGITAKGECKADREKFCKDVKKGDLKGMHACMKSHDAELSEACKSHRSQAREKSKEIKKACKKDYKKLCKGTQPGEGRIIKCLKEKEAELSADCKGALANTNIEH